MMEKIQYVDSNFDYIFYQKYNWTEENPSAKLYLNKNTSKNNYCLSQEDKELLTNKISFENQLYNYFIHKNTND